MLYAIVDRKKIRAFPRGRGICPFCNNTMIAKCGLIVIWHWAHRASESCLAEYEGETDWHLFYKSLVRPDRAEIIVENNGIRRIMDILGNNNTPMEFQHSPITAEVIQKRERFWDACFCKMVWVFDIRDVYSRGRFIFRHPITYKVGRRVIYKDDHDYVTFRWKYTRKTIAQCKFPVLLQITNTRFIELGRMYINRKTGRCGGWGYHRTLEWFLYRYLSKIFSKDIFDKAVECFGAVSLNDFFHESKRQTKLQIDRMGDAIREGVFGEELSDN